MATAANLAASQSGQGGSTKGMDQRENLDHRVGGASKVGSGRGFVDAMMDWPQVLPMVEIPFREPKFSDGEMFFPFSRTKIKQSAKSFRFSIVLKFLSRRPSLDHVRGFIKTCWGLRVLSIVGQLKNPRNILVWLSNEENFIAVMTRGNSEIAGPPYWVFHWT